MFDDSLLDDESALARADVSLRTSRRQVRGYDARPASPRPAYDGPPRDPRQPAAGGGRRGAGLPVAAGGARAVVPGAVRGLARAAAARLGRQPRPGRRARARRAATRTPRPPSPRRSVAAASWSSPVPSARWSPSTRPAATRSCCRRSPATSSPPRWWSSSSSTCSTSRRSSKPGVVADALDEVAVNCSPFRDIAVNPAKNLASAIADTQPDALGRHRARRARGSPGRRVHPARHRPRGARGRRRAPAAGDRAGAGARRLRRPVRRRRRRPGDASQRW